jgi:hypothetical protein
MLKRRILKLTVAAATIASVVGLTGLAATAATTAQTATTTAASASLTATHPVQGGTQVPKSASPDQAYDNCASGYYCDYVGTDGSDICLLDNATDRYWSDAGCRNVDESFANRTSGLVRLYYSPDLGGAWVCIDASKYSNNLSGYVFNNGSGKAGYGASLENDVASSSTASGSCSNPLNLP